MLVGNISEDEDTSEINSLLREFPASTNVLVVDTNLTTLLNMKQIMRQYAYGVTIEADAEKALAFLTNCKHEINIVIWDFHMPGINGLQALEIINSKMDLPVVIMSDENQSESVMKATINGACDYIMKPVKEEVIANIWQHLVRKRMMPKPNLTPPVQSDLAHQSNGLDQNKADAKIVDQDKADAKIVDQEQSIDKNEEIATKKRRMTTWAEETQLVQSDLVETEGLGQDDCDFIVINQDNGEQNIGKKDEISATKKPRMTTRAEEIQLVQTDLVQTNGLGKDNCDFIVINQDNGQQNIEDKVVVKKRRKPRMTWSENLHQKFLDAIESIGGIEKANPKLLLERLEEMNVQGLTRNNVASHLQKHRISLEENQIAQETQELGWSSTAYSQFPSLQGSNNVNTAISSYQMNGRSVNQFHENQYQNSYMTRNNNPFITNSLPRLPYIDHHLNQHQQQQYHQSSTLPHQQQQEQYQPSSHLLDQHQQQQYQSSPLLHQHQQHQYQPSSVLHQNQQEQYQSSHPLHQHQQQQHQSSSLVHQHQQQQHQPSSLLHQNQQKDQYPSSHPIHQQQQEQYQSSHPLHQQQQEQYQSSSLLQQDQQQQYQSSSLLQQDQQQQYQSSPLVHQHQQQQYQSSSLLQQDQQQQYQSSPLVHQHQQEQYQSSPLVHQHQQQQYQSSPLVHQHQQQQYQSSSLLQQDQQQQYQSSSLVHQHQQQQYQSSSLLNQHQQQQYQSSAQFNYVMSNEQPEQASGTYATDLELSRIYPSLPYEPKDFPIQGYNFSQY